MHQSTVHLVILFCAYKNPTDLALKVFVSVYYYYKVRSRVIMSRKSIL